MSCSIGGLPRQIRLPRNVDALPEAQQRALFERIHRVMDVENANANANAERGERERDAEREKKNEVVKQQNDRIRRKQGGGKSRKNK